MKVATYCHINKKELNIIKFGGSVITSPDAPDLFDQATVERLGRELCEHGKGCILIHGTGHVGKPPAKRYGYLESGHIPSERNHLALSIKKELRALNARFVTTMLNASINAVPIDAATFFNQTMDGFLDSGRRDWLLFLLEQELTPVFYGDMIPVAGGGFSVFSSDLMAMILCREYHPAKMLFVSNVQGVYRNFEGGEPSLLEELTPGHLKQLPSTASDSRDVSGGMRSKMQYALEIARHCRQCFICSGAIAGRVQGFLKGEKVIGTLVRR